MAERNDVADEGQDDLAWVDDEIALCEANDDETIDDEFHFSTHVCSHCEGYYGPCFGQHTCVTCHLFLYPDITQSYENNLSEVIVCKSLTYELKTLRIAAKDR